VKLKVRLFASYAQAAGWREKEIEVPDACTAKGVLEVLRHGPLIALPGLGRPLYAVNRKHVPPDTAVAAGDEVAIFPPVSGGSGAPAYTQVTSAPLDPAPLLALVRAPGHGAVLVFEGTVRDSPGPVAAITYEAYEEMAAETLAAIKAEVEVRHPGAVLAMAHRVGRLAVGETSVVVACGAPHRREAFAACRRAMDRIKESMPVWKCVEASDGSTSWS
jgi:molybdopterin synthase catalytic subunit/molybdopterin converting factor small subunit